MKPKVSIITVVLNNKRGLQETFDSIFSQDYPNLDLVVIDGGSTDGTLELIKNYQDKIAYHVSEPDSGIYNAMNKGIKAATGEYVLFMNSGDYFTGPKSLGILVNHGEDRDIVYGNMIFRDKKSDQKIIYPDKLTFLHFYHRTLPHPGTIIRRALFEKYGYYDETLRLVSDWAFFLDVIGKHGATYKYVDKPISVFLLGGRSADGRETRRERNIYLSRNYAFYMDDILRLRSLHQGYIHLKRNRVIDFFWKFTPRKTIKMLLGQKSP